MNTQQATSHQRLAWFVACAVVLAWGVNFVLAKHALNQLVLPGGDDVVSPGAGPNGRELVVMGVLAVLAALSVKLPELIGFDLGDNDDGGSTPETYRSSPFPSWPCTSGGSGPSIR